MAIELIWAVVCIVVIAFLLWQVRKQTKKEVRK